MLIDLTPLRRHRDLRFLFFGQFVSFYDRPVAGQRPRRLDGLVPLASVLHQRRGVVWVAAVLACIPFLPAFWRYDRSARNTPDSERLRGRSPGHPPRAFREDSANKGRCFAVNRR